MSWWDVHRRQIEWAGIVLFLAVFWTGFGVVAAACVSVVL
jgi:hypothetical protein